MRDAGVARSGELPPNSGEARLLASGALLQQVAQGSGLLALLAIVTVLARRLSVAELGVYGLVASLAGYLLVVRNSVSSSAVRAMAAAADRRELAVVFSGAAAVYAAAGVATGLLIAAAGLLIAQLVLDGTLARDARVGALGLAAVTAVGVTASVWLDALRAERRFARAAGVEIVAVALYLATMLGLIVGDVGLGGLIAASGALPLLSGLLAAAAAGSRLRFERPGVSRAQLMAIVPTAGWVLVVELCNVAIYAFSRVILGAYRSPTAVGLFEGPVRAHNLLYALGGALYVPVVPTASRYVALADERRLRELVLRGTRYTLALFVPVCVTLALLSGPILEVWLGERYAGGDAALSVLVSYWALYGGLAVMPGFLVGAGRARELARIMLAVAAASLLLTLLLTPELGVEGPAIATAGPFLAAFPFVLALGARASGVRATELLARSFVPAWGLGAVLALALAAARAVVEPDSLVAVLGVAVGGLVLYWLAYYALVLVPGERAFARSLLSRRA